MSVFLSGSAIELDNIHNGMFGQSENDPFFGKYLGSLVVDGVSEKDFGVVKVDYDGKNSGDVIKFRVEAREFLLSDVSIRPNSKQDLVLICLRLKSLMSMVKPDLIHLNFLQSSMT